MYRNAAMTPDAREARQPRWVQETLQALRRRVEDAERAADEARLAGGPADTDVLLDPYSTTPIRLPKGELVRFVTEPQTPGRPHNAWAHVRVRAQPTREGSRRYVEVMAGHGLLVEPQSSNVVKIWLT